MKTHPPLNTPLKIVNKLNSMVLTVGQGQSESKPGQLLSTIDHNLIRQKFTFYETPSKNDTYFIECLNGKEVCSTKRLGDKEYSNTRAEKYDGDSNQMWRIVPYSELMEKQFIPDLKKLNISEEQKSLYPHLTEYEKKQSKEQKVKEKVESHSPLYQGQSNNLAAQQKSHQNKTQQKSQPIIQLGYEFPSGPNVRPIIQNVGQPYTQPNTQPINKQINQPINHPSSQPINPLSLGYSSSFSAVNQNQGNNNFYSNNYSATNDFKSQSSSWKSSSLSNIWQYKFTSNDKPYRFPIKVKKNMEPQDYENEGWYYIENVKYGLVMEIEGGIDENAMNIVLNKIYGNRNQLWKFV